MYIDIPNAIAFKFDEYGNIVQYGKQVIGADLVTVLSDKEVARLEAGGPVSLLGNKIIVGQPKTKEEIEAEKKAQEDAMTAEDARRLAMIAKEEADKKQEENEVKQLEEILSLESLSSKDLAKAIKLLAKSNLKRRKNG